MTPDDFKEDDHIRCGKSPPGLSGAQPTGPLFPIGALVATPGALAALARTETDPRSFIVRHQAGDWGRVGPEDAASNDRAVRVGSRILSSYLLPDGTKLWIITEADRSSTCLLLPEDY